MMEERYHATTQSRFYPDMSNVNKNITVEAKLIRPPTYYNFKIHKVDKHMIITLQSCETKTTLPDTISLTRFIETRSVRIVQIETDNCTRTPYRM